VLILLYFNNFFCSIAYTGYIQQVQEVQESKNSKNLYFDIRVQTAKDDSKSVRVTVHRGESSKRQLFLDKLQAQQPITPIQTPGSTKQHSIPEQGYLHTPFSFHSNQQHQWHQQL